MRARTPLLTTILALTTSACLEKCAPGRVGSGVARLTVRNVGNLVQALNDDDACGFESPSVKSSFTTSGEIGRLGAVTWRVEGCRLDYRFTPRVTEDCDGVQTILRGAVTASAERTIVGTLTGDRAQPVVPAGPDAVTVSVDAELEDFLVETSNSDAVLTQRSGRVRAVAHPRLAASASEGVCMIATPHLRLEAVEYVDAQVHVAAEGRRFEVDVPRSQISAVNGIVGDRENHLAGSITVWGHDVDVPSDEDGLDPEYDRARFVEAFACADDLARPVTHACAGLGPVLAQGAARLSIRSLGAIASLVEADATCGFSSSAALDRARILEGTVGGVGKMAFTVEGCRIERPPGTVSATSCTGTETLVSGAVEVTATKVMSGRLTGDRAQPVVPTDDRPAVITVERAVGDGLRVAEAGTGLTLRQAELSGRVTPRVAMDPTLGACAAPTPIARFEGVSLTGPVAIEAEVGRFETVVGGADLRAVNGAWGGDENALSGHIVVADERFDLPAVAGDHGLDPDYDPTAFAAAWQCGDVDLDAPFACDFVDPLGQGAAQLTARLTGAIAEALEADAACGFASDAVRFDPVIEGELGRPGGRGTFSVTEPCALVFAEPTVLSEDCHGTRLLAQGTARVTGTKTLTGYVSGDPVEPIVPTHWDPAEIAIDADFTELRLWTDPGQDALTVHRGRLRATVRPRTAIDDATGACSIPTPVAKLEDMAWSGAALRVESAGRAFEIEVPTSHLTAVNGRRDGEENAISGTIVVDGSEVSIPVRGEGLDPSYDPERFVAAFACAEDLTIPTDPSQCDMTTPLGEGAARLVISALGSVTGVVNEDDECGYSKLGVLTDPDRVEGDPGEPGLMAWSIEGCVPEYDTPFEEDCLGRETIVSGEISVTGRRIVRGVREEIEILFIDIDSIAPDAPDRVRIEHDRIDLVDFETYDLEPDAQAPLRGIRFASGTLSGVVEPMTGRNTRTDAYDIPTKIARMTDVHLEDAPATILYEGKTFEVHIDRADLRAFNGAYRGEANEIEGEIVIDGTRIVLAPQPLDPDFEQADFDARYQCTRRLDATLPP